MGLTTIVVGVVCAGLFLLIGPIGVIVAGLLMLLAGVSNRPK